VAANYTRQIEFKVNDRAIRQSTDRIVKSLTSIEKKLDVISKAFEKASASTKKTSTALNAWEKGIVALTRPLVKTVKDFGKLETSIKVSAKALAELTRGKGLTGLQSLLSEASKAQSLLLTTNSGYVNALKATLKLEGDINFELVARQRILDDLNRRQGITGGPGISGLRKSLSEQQAILDRMLSSQGGYLNQAKRVKDIEGLITQEMKERERIMGKLVTKQEFLAKMGRGVGKAAGRAAQGIRPGRGIEARGLGLAGLGVAGVGVHSGQMAAGITPSVMTPIASGVGGVAKAMGLGAIKGASFLGVLNAIGAAAMAQPQLIGLYATALLIWGNRVNEIAVGPIKLFHKGLWGLGKMLAETHRPVNKLKAGLKSFSRESLEPLNTKFEQTTRGAKKFEIALNGLARAKERLAKTRKQIAGSGFLDFDAKANRIQMETSAMASPEGQAYKERKWLDRVQDRIRAKREVQRTRGLTIEERINEVLRKRGKIMTANGKIENKNRIFKGGVGGAASSAMIGGGFPLLFGQGGASAVGGGIGGLAGGAIGGGFGFGLSIVGTALGQYLTVADQFQESLGGLNESIKRVGGSSGITAEQIKKMGETFGMSKQEAVEAMDVFKRFGDDAGILFRMFGDNPAAFKNLTGMQDLQGVLAAISGIENEISLEKEFQLRVDAKRGNLAKVRLEVERITMEIAFGRRKSALEEITILEVLTQAMSKTIDTLTFGLKGSKSVIDLQKEGLEELAQDVANWEKVWDRLSKKLDKMASGESSVDKITSMYKQMGKTIEDGVVNSIEGAIKGTKTLGEVANSVFNQLASQFLRYGINSILGEIPLIGKMFKADGGPVSGGSPYIVGEKGPELFVPNSSGNIVPNHAMGGSMIVNVDASGSSAEGDDDRSRQLGELIGAAVQSEIIRQQRPGGTLY